MKKLEDIACPLLEAFVLAAKSDVSAVVGKTRRNYRNVNEEGKSAAHYLSKSAIDKVRRVFVVQLARVLTVIVNLTRFRVRVLSKAFLAGLQSIGMLIASQA